MLENKLKIGVTYNVDIEELFHEERFRFVGAITTNFAPEERYSNSVEDSDIFLLPSTCGRDSVLENKFS